MYFCSPQEGLYRNLSISVTKWSSYHTGMLCLQNSIFWSIWREKEAAWLSSKLILLSLCRLPSLFPRGFGWLSLPQLYVNTTRSTWPADVSGLRAKMALVVPLNHLHHFNRCGSISGSVWQTHLRRGPPAFDERHTSAAFSQGKLLAAVNSLYSMCLCVASTILIAKQDSLSYQIC